VDAARIQAISRAERFSTPGFPACVHPQITEQPDYARNSVRIDFVPITEITDLADPRLADYAHLTDVALKKARGTEHGLYLAESLLVFERGLRAGHVPRSVLALGTSADEAIAALAEHGYAAGPGSPDGSGSPETPGSPETSGSPEIPGSPGNPASPEIPVFVGPGELLAELTGYILHRGLIASMNRPALVDPAELLANARRIVVLENVVDPTNVGAIFRSAGAIGADAVLVTPQCSDPFYRRAIRVSMGTVLQVPWTRVGDWPSTRELLVGAGFHIAALALTPDAVSLRDFARTVPEKLALVLGAEGEGLTPEAIAAADTVLKIPMRHGIDSLNVAAASAVAMWAVAE
jgi:tRNA G18 (ribose-2'-O)-methylase SpoU